MTDFFTRLAEQALGWASEVRPLVTPRFAPGQCVADEAFSDPIEEAEANSDEKAPHVLRERGTLTHSFSPDPMPALVSKRGSFLDTPMRAGTETTHLVAPHSEPSPDRLVQSHDKKEDRGPMSSSSNSTMSATRLDSAKRATLNATSARRRPGGSDRREEDKAMPSKKTIRPRELETYASIRPLIRSRDSSAREIAKGYLQSLLQSSRTEENIQTSPGETIPQKSLQKPAMPIVFHRSIIPSWEEDRSIPERFEADLPGPSAQTPTIRVTIGRVEVKAIMPPSQPTRVKPERPGPTLSLEDYLRQRNEGKR